MIVGVFSNVIAGLGNDEIALAGNWRVVVVSIQQAMCNIVMARQASVWVWVR